MECGGDFMEHMALLQNDVLLLKSVRKTADYILHYFVLIFAMLVFCILLICLGLFNMFLIIFVVAVSTILEIRLNPEIKC